MKSKVLLSVIAICLLLFLFFSRQASLHYYFVFSVLIIIFIWAELTQNIIQINVRNLPEKFKRSHPDFNEIIIAEHVRDALCLLLAQGQKCSLPTKNKYFVVKCPQLDPDSGNFEIQIRNIRVHPNRLINYLRSSGFVRKVFPSCSKNFINVVVEIIQDSPNDLWKVIVRTQDCPAKYITWENNRIAFFATACAIVENFSSVSQAVTIIANTGISLSSQSNDLKIAELLVETATKLAPKSWLAHFSKGFFLYFIRDYDRAISSLRLAHVLSRESTNDKDIVVRILFYIGRSYADKGDSLSAIKNWEEVVRLKPDCAEAFYNIGVAWDAQGQTIKALKYYEKAISKKNNIAEAYHNLGVILMKQGSKDIAITNFQKASQLKPELFDWQDDLGIAFSENDKLDLALEHLLVAKEINPSHSNSYYNIGVVCMKKEEWDEAIKIFKETIALDSYCVEAYYNLGIAYINKCQFGEAVNRLQQALELRQDFIGIYHNLGLAWTGRGELNKAIRQYRRLIKKDIKNEVAQRMLGILLLLRCYEKLDFDELYKVFDCFNALLKNNPNDHIALYYKALLNQMIGDIPEAVLNVQEALTYAPENKEYKTLLLRIQNQMDKEKS